MASDKERHRRIGSGRAGVSAGSERETGQAERDLQPASVRNPLLVEHRRQALIAAAIKVFAEKGYHSARVSEIAEAAGISQGTVYNYVRSKEDILYLVCLDNLIGYEGLVTEATATAGSGLEKLKALVRATVQAVIRYKDHHLIMVRELHHIEKRRRREFLAAAAEKRGVCERLLRQAAEEADLTLPNTLLAANLMIFLPNMIVSRGWDFRNSVSEEEIEAFLVSFIWRGLGLPTEALEGDGDPL